MGILTDIHFEFWEADLDCQAFELMNVKEVEL